MNEPEKPKKGWGCLQWGVVVSVLLAGTLLLISIWSPHFGLIADMSNQTSTSNNARQTIMAMKIWAQENNGAYPDSGFPERPTANQVFRKLIQAEILEDERISGAKKSLFVPDGKIGIAPTFDEAVQPGENHWMITAGQNFNGLGEIPLIFENAITSTWPLRWHYSHVEEPIRGRTWTNGKVIVGFQDSRVELIQLKKKGEVMVLPERVMTPYGRTPLPALKILDIE
jgi:hypothetical protein